MKGRVALVMMGIAAVTALARPGQVDAARLTFETARKLESVDGDLKKAIELYLTVADSGDRTLAEQAHVRLADTYRKLGNAQEQEKHEQLARTLAAQGKSVSASVRAAPEKSPVSSLFMELAFVLGDRDVFITRDGRYLSMPTGDGFVTRDIRKGRVETALPGTSTRMLGTTSLMLSPDGQRVARVVFRPAEKAALDRPGDASVSAVSYEVHVEDRRSGARPAMVLKTNGYTPYLAGWSPDGTRVLLTRLKEDDRTREIVWWSTVDGSVTRVVQLGWRAPASDRPSVSPDGRYIAYSALANTPVKPTRGGGPAAAAAAGVDSFSQSIYVVAADGSSDKAVVEGASVNEAPIWSDNGSHILFVSDRTGSFALHAVGIRDGNAVGKPFPIKGTVVGERIHPVAMTRDGAFYYVKDSAGTDVFRQAAVSTGPESGPATRLSDNAVNRNSNPEYSPDGSRIAFKRDLRPNGVTRLVVHDLKTGAETTFDVSGMDDSPAVWLQDGTGLFVRASRPAINPPAVRREILKLDLKTKTFSSVFASEGRYAPARISMAVSRDGSTLYIADQSSRLVALDLATAVQRDVVQAMHPISTVALSPDGRVLVLTTAGAVARVNVDGTGYRELVSNIRSAWLTAKWAADGNSILYLDAESRIARVPANGGPSEPTGIQMRGFSPWFTVRPPSGSHIAYSDRAPAELWRVDGLSAALTAVR